MVLAVDIFKAPRQPQAALLTRISCSSLLVRTPCSFCPFSRSVSSWSKVCGLPDCEEGERQCQLMVHKSHGFDGRHGNNAAMR